MNSKDYNNYPAYFETDGTTYTVRLRNWDGAFGCASSIKEAQEEAYKLLFDVFDTHIKKKLIIPAASKAEEGDFKVKIPLDISLKIMLINLMRTEKYKKADIAKGLNIPAQRMTTFLSLKKNTNLNFFEKAFSYMNRNIEISI